MRKKIMTRQELKAVVTGLKDQKRRVVFTNGCFDILHVGHVRYLEKAKEYGEHLVVAINSDSSVRAIKGGGRPVIPQDERAEIVAALACVDSVVIFDELDPLALIKLLEPHVLVKGGDWTEETIIGGDVVKASGGTVIVIPFVEGISTSGIIDRIAKGHGLRPESKSSQKSQ